MIDRSDPADRVQPPIDPTMSSDRMPGMQGLTNMERYGDRSGLFFSVSFNPFSSALPAYKALAGALGKATSQPATGLARPYEADNYRPREIVGPPPHHGAHDCRRFVASGVSAERGDPVGQGRASGDPTVMASSGRCR